MNFDNVNHIAIPEGNVKRITSGGVELWNADYLRIPYLTILSYDMIDSGVKLGSTGTTDVEAEFQFDSNPGTGNVPVLRLGNLVNGGTWVGTTANKWSNGSGTNSTVPCTTRALLKVLYSKADKKQSLYVDGLFISDRNFSASTNNTVLNNNTLTICYKSAPSVRCYSYKIYDNGSLVRDMVPVRRRTANVECMFDRVTGNYYDKVQTT